MITATEVSEIIKKQIAEKEELERKQQLIREGKIILESEATIQDIDRNINNMIKQNKDWFEIPNLLKDYVITELKEHKYYCFLYKVVNENIVNYFTVVCTHSNPTVIGSELVRRL